MTSNISAKRSDTGAQAWIEWTNLTLGILLAASPWLGLGGSASVAWNAAIVGCVIAFVAAVAMARPSASYEKTNLWTGAWLLLAPWALGFSNYSGAMWTSVVIGLSVACFAALQLSLLKSPARA